MIIVTINGCPRQPYPTKWAGLFEARVDGRLICARSRQPFLDAARVLLAEGVDPAAVIVMRHAGSAIDRAPPGRHPTRGPPDHTKIRTPSRSIAPLALQAADPRPGRQMES
jgi:hypothetical protein